jgi:PAS domain-containing protein
MPDANVPSKEKPAPLCYSSEEARTVLDSLSAHIAIMDEDGVILDTNRAWRDFAVMSGMPADYTSIGENYLALCEATEGEDGNDARAVAAGIRNVINGDVDEFLYDYPCHSADGPHWYYMRAIRMSGDGPLRDRGQP